MNVYYIIAAAAALVLVGWFVLQLRKPAAAADGSPVASGSSLTKVQRVYMLRQGEAGPEFVPCFYDTQDHGYKVGSQFYPREFCRVMDHGLVVLATKMLMPADGDTKHGGSWGDLREVDQAGWCASWADYDAARRRLNWAAVWNRGDGSLQGLKTLASGLQVVVLLILLFVGFSLRSSIAAVGGELDALKPVPVASAAPVAAPVDPGRPTGDK